MPCKLLCFCAILAVHAAVSAEAHAEPALGAELALSRSTDSAAPARRWYGWQTLSLDGAALGLGLAGARLGQEHEALGITLGGGGFMTYALGGPAIHWAHERRIAAGASLAVRIGLPLLSSGLLVAADAGRCTASGEPEHEGYCRHRNEAAVIAAVLSGVAASAFDAAVLGWEPRHEPTARLEVAPLLAWDGRSGGLAGLGGSF
jgi:hypothetical protein